MTPLDIIRNIAKDMYRSFYELPSWRFISRNLSIIRASRKYRKFLAYDIYDRMDALASILCEYHKKRPKVFEDMDDLVRVGAISITINIDDLNAPYMGTVTYTPSKREFDIDVSINNKSDVISRGYKFSLSKTSIPNKITERVFNMLQPAINSQVFLIIYELSELLYGLTPYTN